MRQIQGDLATQERSPADNAPRKQAHKLGPKNFARGNQATAMNFSFQFLFPSMDNSAGNHMFRFCGNCFIHTWKYAAQKTCSGDN